MRARARRTSITGKLREAHTLHSSLSASVETRSVLNFGAVPAADLSILHVGHVHAELRCSRCNTCNNIVRRMIQCAGTLRRQASKDCGVRLGRVHTSGHGRRRRAPDSAFQCSGIKCRCNLPSTADAAKRFQLAVTKRPRLSRPERECAAYWSFSTHYTERFCCTVGHLKGGERTLKKCPDFPLGLEIIDPNRRVASTGLFS